MKKILYYCDSSQYGGAEKYLTDLVANLDPDKYPAVCVFPKSKSAYRFRSRLNGKKVYELSRLQIWFGLIGIIRKEKPDIVHLNMHIPFSCFFAIAASKLTKVRKLFATVHSVVPPASRFLPMRFVKSFLSSALLPKIDEFICVSNKSRDEFCSTYGISKDKVDVVYNGLDPGKYNITDVSKISKSSVGIKEGQIVIGTVSRLVKDKGIEYLLEAVAILAKKNDDICCLMIGDGNLRSKLERKAENLGIKDRTIFAGHIDNVISCLLLIDIFVMPSLRETFGLSTLEAMLAGKPVIATDVGGIPELVNNGNTGILVPPKDPDAIGKAVIELLSDNKKRERMGNNAQQRAHELFTLKNMVSGTQKIYDEVGS